MRLRVRSSQCVEQVFVHVQPLTGCSILAAVCAKTSASRQDSRSPKESGSESAVLDGRRARGACKKHHKDQDKLQVSHDSPVRDLE